MDVFQEFWILMKRKKLII